MSQSLCSRFIDRSKAVFQVYFISKAERTMLPKFTLAFSLFSFFFRNAISVDDDIVIFQHNLRGVNRDPEVSREKVWKEKDKKPFHVLFAFDSTVFLGDPTENAKKLSLRETFSLWSLFLFHWNSLLHSSHFPSPEILSIQCFCPKSIGCICKTQERAWESEAWSFEIWKQKVSTTNTTLDQLWRRKISWTKSKQEREKFFSREHVLFGGGNGILTTFYHEKVVACRECLSQTNSRVKTSKATGSVLMMSV